MEMPYTFVNVAEGTKHNTSAVSQPNANRQRNNLKFKKGIKEIEHKGPFFEAVDSSSWLWWIYNKSKAVLSNSKSFQLIIIPTVEPFVQIPLLAQHHLWSGAKKESTHAQTNLSSAHQWKTGWFCIWTMNILGPILSSHGLTALNPGFTVCVWGDESLGRLQRALFRFLLGAASASVSSLLLQLHSASLSTVYTAHLRGLCHQLQESAIEYVSAVFFFFCRGACQHQLCINLLKGEGTKHKQALREAYGNASS